MTRKTEKDAMNLLLVWVSFCDLMHTEQSKTTHQMNNRVVGCGWEFGILSELETVHGT